eukprot:1138731-Pelagomonas_calceolata.AAC.5
MHQTELYPPYLFPRNFSKRYRLTPSRPDAILITPVLAKLTPESFFFLFFFFLSSSSASSHHVLRSRHGNSLRTSVTNRVRQPHQLNAIQRHVHLTEIKYCEDTRPGQQLEAAQRQHADFCKLISAKAATVYIILLGVGGICYNEHILYQFKQLGLDHQRAIYLQLARKLHFFVTRAQALKDMAT